MKYNIKKLFETCWDRGTDSIGMEARFKIELVRMMQENFRNKLLLWNALILSALAITNFYFTHIKSHSECGKQIIIYCDKNNLKIDTTTLLVK